MIQKAVGNVLPFISKSFGFAGKHSSLDQWIKALLRYVFEEGACAILFGKGKDSLDVVRTRALTVESMNCDVLFFPRKGLQQIMLFTDPVNGPIQRFIKFGCR